MLCWSLTKQSTDPGKDAKLAGTQQAAKLNAPGTPALSGAEITLLPWESRKHRETHATNSEGANPFRSRQNRVPFSLQKQRAALLHG